MIAERKTKYLVPKNEVVFLKEAQANTNSFQEFGWRNVGTLFKGNILNYLIEWCAEVIDEDIDDDGTIKKKYHGIRRIPDIMAMKEMQAYRDGVNVDRIVALASLVAFVKILQANSGYKKRVDNETQIDLEKSQELYKLKSNPFSNLGRSKRSGSSRRKGGGFKHMR